MSNHIPTVMGPEGDSHPKGLYEPPKLTAKTDKFLWRQAVRIWTQKIKSFAKGGDNKAKGLANSLGITLYSAMDYSFVQVLDNAIANDELKLVSDDDEEETINQKDVVEKIIDLVAKDSVTDGVRRLVKMTQNVHGCRREKSETFEAYAERFRGLAQMYLNHCRSRDTNQDSQNFAMLLLENARLTTSTFNNIVSILIADAKNKSDTQIEVVCMSKTKYNAIESSCKESIELWNMYTMQSNAPNEVDPAVTEQQVQASLEKHKTTIENAKSTKSRLRQEDRVPYAISLEDAVAALKDIKTNDAQQGDDPKPVPDAKSPAYHTTAESVNHGKKGILNGTMMTKRNGYQGRNEDNHFDGNGYRKRPKAYIPANTGVKAHSRCIECGEHGHWRGDKECSIRRIDKRVRFDTDKTRQNADKPRDQYFQ